MPAFNRLPRIPLVFAALLFAVSCASDPPAAPETKATEAEKTGNTQVKVERAVWQAQAGENAYEGNIAFVNRTGGKIHLQLVNADAVNLALLFPEKGAGARPVEHSFFAVGRGQNCQLVASDPPYQVTLEPGDGAWLNGTFAGTLGCPDYSALEVKGSFQVSVAGE